jgi:hypothetical protein
LCPGCLRGESDPVDTFGAVTVELHDEHSVRASVHHLACRSLANLRLPDPGDIGEGDNVIADIEAAWLDRVRGGHASMMFYSA